MQKNTSQRWLALAFILFVFGNSWEPGVGLDTATYGAIARGILESGSWFSLKLAPGIFDPFIEHPYLALWLDALSMKLLGATAQGIHFTSSVLGIVGVMALFSAVRRLVDENTAFLTCFCLLLINVFMNFMSSGWLDMPMLAFILIGFYFAVRVVDGKPVLNSLLSGFFLSLAVLVKGVAAVGIFPVVLFLAMQNRWKIKPLLAAAMGFLTPLILFTWAHYQSQGFIFWEAYLPRQLFGHNDLNKVAQDHFSFLWYPHDTLEHAHIIALLFIPGVYFLWKKNHRGLAITVLGEILIHFFVYGFSSRQNRQYIVPIFPWLAVAAAFFIGLRWKVPVLSWSKGIFGLSVVYFFAVSFLPITVHTMSGAEIYAFLPDVKDSKIQKIYFEANAADRATGEMTSSYVAWYLHKVPVMYHVGELDQIFSKLTHEEAILVRRVGAENEAYINKVDHVCGWNNDWILISTSENCTAFARKKRTPAAKRVHGSI